MSESTILELSVPADELAMARTLADVPDMTVEIERLVAHNTGPITPYFWIRGGDLARFESNIREDPTVAGATRLDEHRDGTLYRATWQAKTDSLVVAFLETGAVVLEAIGKDDEWELRLRFDSEEDVSAFHEHCRANGIDFEVSRLYNPSSPKSGGQFGVSPKQREALITALELGYYEFPRDTDMIEIANQLEISQQALSNRLRRAHRNLVSNVLTVEEAQFGQ